MYQIFFNGYPIYDPRDQELQLRGIDCDLAVGEAGSLSFTIDSDHPYAHALTKMTGVMDLRAEGRSIFKGRITRDSQDFELSRDIDVEGLLACLNDSVIPPFNFPDDFLEDAAYTTAAESGNVVRFFLEWVLAEHNSQVGPEQQVLLGDVTVSDPNNYISRASSDYLTSMEVIRKKLEDLLGGYLLADYSGETTVLHYYADLPLTNIQTVEYGENLLDLVTETDATELYTAILPIGADGLTLETLDDGELTPGFFKASKIIYSQAAEDQYNGARIVRVEEWKDVTEPINLQTKALAKLSTEGVMLSRTIEVKAVDLGGVVDDMETAGSADSSAVVGKAIVGKAVIGSTGADPVAAASEPAEIGVARFVVGRYVQLNSTPHGFSVAYPLMKLGPDVLNPGNTKITLGATYKTASDTINANQSKNEEQLQQHQIELNKQQQNLTTQAQITQESITSAIQTCESMIFEALRSYSETGDLAQLRAEMTSRFAIMADEISASFTSTTERINNVDGDLQATIETLEKHFDFSLDGLVIRAGANAMTLTLDNDLIIFKKDGQQFGWWDGVDFHTGNIVIDVTERAQFGNFAFIPREGGNLSLLKVR